MDLEKSIFGSPWWAAAEQMADRHYPPGAGVTVADHLLSVHEMVCLLLQSATDDHYLCELRHRLDIAGDRAMIARDLRLVALLHDIGKPRESKREWVVHPLTGKRVAGRHPAIGAVAALELIPETCRGRALIVALVAKHSTGWSWFRQWTCSQQLPSKKAWQRLDQALPVAEAGLGVVHLVLFKLADIDGHADIQDVPWFVERANQGLLDDLGLSLPVPPVATLERLRSVAIDGTRALAPRLED